MTRLVVDLPARPDDAARDLLQRLLYWVTPDLRDVRVDDGSRVHVDYLGTVPPAEVTSALRHAAEQILGRDLRFPVTQRQDHRIALVTPAATDPFPDLLRRGWVSREAAGAHTYTDELAVLFQTLDDRFVRGLAGQRPRPVVLPALLAPDTLLRTGSLTSAPHAAHYVFHLREAPDLPARFAEEAVDAEHTTVDLHTLPSTATHPDAVLSTAACQPYFRALRGRTLTGPLVVTARATCYRYESGATDGLRRAREFAVRELVCVGTAEEVARQRERLLASAADLLRELSLSARIVTASDPFFIDTTAVMRMYQLSFEVKHELLATLPFDGTELAVGSVNHHGDHFGAAWDIRTADGAHAHSCCLGLGIDRWCYAVLAQYGLDPAGWPSALRPDGSAPA
jgi:seryl-tRNA synthetase